MAPVSAGRKRSPSLPAAASAASASKAVKSAIGSRARSHSSAPPLTQPGFSM